MQELKQIQEENRKAVIMACNPEAKTYEEALEMELGFGCELYNNNDYKIIIDVDTNTRGEDWNFITRSYENCMRHREIRRAEIKKIIGKPLTLTRVLIALKGRWGGFFVDNIFLPSENNPAYAKINLLNTGDEIISLNWYLTKETLEEQSEKTQREINKLLICNKKI
jgi:hypothetical protein